MSTIQDVPAETIEPPVPPAPPEPPEERKPRWFPTAFTVLAAVLLVVWALSFVIPSGAYEIDAETGGPKPGTYQEIDTDKSVPHQFYKLWNAPTNGLYGIENEAGNISVDNTGVLYGAAQIFFFVLAIGAFISVTMKTGAIQAGIGRLALRFRHSPALLIVVLMAVFALAGTTEGMAEESLGFFVLLVPLALGARLRPHDRLRDRLPRRGLGRARLDRQPVRDRRRVGRRGHRRG